MVFPDVRPRESFRPAVPAVPPGEVHIYVGGKMVVKIINVGEEG
jgi:hypothetical protein